MTNDQVGLRYRMSGNEPDWSHTSTLEATPISTSPARTFVTRHLFDHRLLDSVILCAWWRAG